MSKTFSEMAAHQRQARVRELADVFATFPIGERGRGDEIAINTTEVASYRGHEVQGSYTFEQRTLVVLKNGSTHDVNVSKADFERRIRAALEQAVNVAGGGDDA